MSIQFGKWNFEGVPNAPGYIEKVGAVLAPYGPDSNEAFAKDGVNILYRAFHTTKESRSEKQPHISPSGAVFTWDGRLDNRAELISELRDSLTISSTDVVIVAAAYEKWGARCFAKLVGDWALSIWNPVQHSLILGKDPIGVRHLYYSFDDNQITWSTILDPLARFAGKTFRINEEYIAGWLSRFPAAHLTPYVGIHGVPPSSFVLLRPGKHTVSKYWDFDPAKKIRYRTDAEYEEHFRTVFANAVQRSLRSDSPILAELSGGMDSSSIVCMADTIIARGAAETPRLDTISWYDDANPALDERPYFAKVEEKRGHVGFHIDLSVQRQKDAGLQKPFRFDFERDGLAATPDSMRRPSELFTQYAAHVKSRGHRVVLSGIGGEEATGGGVPTPKPELQNLLARARFFALAHQLNAWATKMRKSQLPLLWEAARGFFPLLLAGMPTNMRPAPWLHPGFVRRNQTALYAYASRVKLFGPLPSFQDNANALDITRRALAYFALRSELLRELRFPYLDRGLLEFVYAIPREQLVRIGQRRSLMRRALVGIVPDELLNRKKKALIQLEPPTNGSPEWAYLAETAQHVVSSSVGIVDSHRFLEALQKARRKEEVPIDSLKRTVFLESWLRHLTIHGVLTNSISTKRRDYSSSIETKELHAPAQPKSSAS